MHGFPLSYVECRARFGRAAGRAGATCERHTIDASGPEGERLSIDVARLGRLDAARVVVVMSGVHGIEGYAGSAIQAAELERLARAPLPAGCAVVHVHAVNPYGMAWWRRQNESNVDLNRNWIDLSAPLPENPGYRELHPFLCPDEVGAESERSFLDAVGRVIERRGYAWVKEAITIGQYEFDDGLYYGGQRRETSTLVLERIAAQHLTRCEQVVIVDLHTGHGAHGACTLLSGEPSGSVRDAELQRLFAGETIETTAENPDATTPHKRGQLAMGVCDALSGVAAAAITLEIGTLDDTKMILAERAEHWLHRKGDVSTPEGGAIAWHHRIASIPDDREWEAAAVTHGLRVLEKARNGLFEERMGARRG